MSRFSTLLPPPNLTGALHLGHMWNATLQDALMRHYANALGRENCHWGFGLDHAGISLQIKVEEKLREEGLRKDDLGEEEFQRRLWQWKEFHEGRIIDQYSRLNYLLDWEGRRFTLDKGSVEYTLGIFRRLYEDGLIYRAERLVNWDPILRTAISDQEVEHRETRSRMYHIRYYYSPEEYLVVATTRPETILGDVAIFVHPKDERYAHLVGRTVKVPIIGREIPILADERIEMDFGTGVMKCTPSHDFMDEQLGKIHGLPHLRVFDQEMRMLLEPYVGMHKDEAKALIIEELKSQDLVEIQDHTSNLSFSSRSGAPVEPTLSLQWFLKSSTLAKEALEYWNQHEEEMEVTKSTKNRELKRILENMEDWCISRQLSWGIVIPVHIRGKEHSLEPKQGFEPSRDVLDTWFSSSLWPAIVFGDRPNLLPLSVLISGKDILLFWISRMVFMHHYTHKCLPFKKIFLHGLLLDSKNRKMSKSLNNGIDPLELLKEFPNDAIRLFFLSNTHQDNNIAFSGQKIQHHSRFLHKLRNASIFIGKQESWNNYSGPLNLNEAQILHLLSALEEELERLYSSFSFGLIVQKSMDFAWDRFCNQYLELYKLLPNNNPSFLPYVWGRLVRLLSPLVPDFASESQSKPLGDCQWQLPEYRSLDWFFEYWRTFEDIRKRLSMARGEEIGVKIYGEGLERHPEMAEYLGYLGHRVEYLGALDGGIDSTRELVFAVYDQEMSLIVCLNLKQKYIEDYRKLVIREKKWLRGEIEFLKGRRSGFSEKTPLELVEEIRVKMERYERNLCFYEEYYGA